MTMTMNSETCGRFMEIGDEPVCEECARWTEPDDERLKVGRAVDLLVQASRVSPVLREAMTTVEDALNGVERRARDAERGLDAAIRERDEAQEWADNLAYAIAPMERIGEHSSGNNPWQNALDIALGMRDTGQFSGGERAVTPITYQPHRRVMR